MCAILAVTLELAAESFAEGPERLEVQLAVLLRQAQTVGAIDARTEASVEAVRLLAFSHGLGTSVLVGRRPGVRLAGAGLPTWKRLFCCT
ncbi:hypothetical protein [Streptomyces sp. NBC_00019]|uniref:hypothetical protein n=1 Tax=Streptomyces sp. NBC_00019 TaxID=2975623 RepID=UPI0032451E82